MKNILIILIVLFAFSEFSYSQFTKKQKVYIKQQIDNKVDTSGVIDGYTLKYIGGELVFSPDISISGAGVFRPDGVTIDTTVGGLARVKPSKVTKWDSVSVKQNHNTNLDDLADGSLSFFRVGGLQDSIDNLQITVATKLNKNDSTIYLTPSDANTAYATKSHTHTEFADTLSKSIGIMDTVITGNYVGWKVDNNITITEISAYTNTGTVTFNIEERGETTPNTAGTDVMNSDLVADDNQQEQTSFSNASLDRNDWLVMTVTSKTGDPTIFGVTIRYVKTN